MKYRIFTLVLGGLLLLGAGCESTTTNTFESKPAEGDTTTMTTSSEDGEAMEQEKDNEAMEGSEDMSEKNDEAMEQASEITLSATALGNRQVQFSWELPEGTANPSAFRLVRSQEENPTSPPGFWFQQAGVNRGTIWVGLPTGEQHFRICLFENGACTVYSNDVMVNVK